MSLHQHYKEVRSDTCIITSPLAVEDHCIQSIPEASPPKWHLAHTSWFFETFLLQTYVPHYRPFQPHFHELFNSYYKNLGPHWRQPERGLLSRPTVDEVMAYRSYVDKHMEELLTQTLTLEQRELIELGLHHEQQHQELLFMDIKNILSQQVQPLELGALQHPLPPVVNKNYISFDGGLVHVGHQNEGFAYDNELPSHQVFIHPFKLRSSLISNGEFLKFMEDGGYENHDIWLSDGWDWVQKQNSHAPLYWRFHEGQWFEYTLEGFKPLDLERPACHINYYEAAAFARFHNKRLPTEFEWELAARQAPDRFADLHHSLWQWTSSSYAPYPGHKWKVGPLGEYNSKFMVNQMVLRGSSAWTPPTHTRITYRNFFYPDKKWPFTGIRLAEDR